MGLPEYICKVNFLKCCVSVTKIYGVVLASQVYWGVCFFVEKKLVSNVCYYPDLEACPKPGFCSIHSSGTLMRGAIVDCGRATKSNWEEKFYQ